MLSILQVIFLISYTIWNQQSAYLWHRNSFYTKWIFCKDSFKWCIICFNCM